MTLIRLENVGKSYPRSGDVLREVNLEIQPGEFVGIVGRSGSGKSTLLNILGTLDRPTSGRVIVDDTDTTLLGDDSLSRLRGQHIGFVFQQFHLLETLDVVHNIQEGLIYGNCAPTHRHARAIDAADRVGLPHRFGNRPAELSGGERQRVAIARALARQPRLLLADEPTGNLDSANGESVLALLHELNQDGTAVVVVTHDPLIASTLPRCIRMSDGRMQSEVCADADVS